MKKHLQIAALCLLICASIIHLAFAESAESEIRSTLILPEGLEIIDDAAFKSSAVHEIYLPASTRYISADALENCREATLMVPENSYSHRWAEANAINYSVYSGDPASRSIYAVSGLEFVSTENANSAGICVSTGANASRLQIRIINDVTPGEVACIFTDLPAHLLAENISLPIEAELPKYFILEANILNINGDKLCSTGKLHVGNKPTQVTFGRDEYTIALGDTLYPDIYFDGADESYAFSAKDASIASVSGAGIMGTAVGSTEISVNSYIGLKDICYLNVVEAATGIEISSDSMDLVINGNNTGIISAQALPHGIGSCFFSSSDPSIASVDRITGVITPLSSGSCVITAETYNGYSKECLLSVRNLLEGVKIGIDPGHQGKADYSKETMAPGSRVKKAKVTTGASGRYTRIPEHVTNLQIGLKLRDQLKAFGAEVYMTRETADVNISNQQRAKMMNELGADMVLRIHCNGSSNKKTNGMSIYVRKTGECKAESAACAKAIISYMAAETGAKNLGVKYSDGYTGLNWSTVPSMLMELGYLSNQKEDKLLNTPEYQDKLVKGMVRGICEYFGRDMPMFEENT